MSPVAGAGDLSARGGGPGGADHLDDGALVRVLDGEASKAELEHARSCVPCRARLGRLEVRLHAFGRAVAEADAGGAEPSYDAAFLDAIGAPGPTDQPAMVSAAAKESRSTTARRPRRTVSLRWAAALAILTVAASAPPVRAFVARAATAMWSMVTGGSVESPEPVAEPIVSTVETAVVGSLLTVVVPQGMTVRLVPTEASAAAARLSGGGPQADLLVRTDGFQVTGAIGGATLEVSVPPAIERVRVEAAGRMPVVVDAPRDSALTVERENGGTG
ncbi:MAG: hypothetical protein WD960_13390 [Gemmatimonadota bacterium]